MTKILGPLYHAVAFLLTGIHSGIAHVISNEGASWALSIVLLTMSMRLLLFPIFVKQIKNQRAMQVLQPKMKELQAKYKNDKEKLNQEMMALWKEHGANPLAGCLPLLLQIPIFISLFHTLREIKPSTCPTGSPVGKLCFTALPGFSQSDLQSAANAKIFSAPISASFKTSSAVFHSLGGSHGATQVLCLVLTVLMGATTFITQKQLMAQNSASGAANPMAQQQKILLYVFPIMFLIYGFYFPVGVLLYWLTTNVWSMAQQRVIIRRMDSAPVAEVVTGSGPAPGSKPAPGAKPNLSKGPSKPASNANTNGSGNAAGSTPAAKSSTSKNDITLPPGGAISPGAARPSPSKPSSNARRPSNNRSKNRKKGRR